MPSTPLEKSRIYYDEATNLSLLFFVNYEEWTGHLPFCLGDLDFAKPPTTKEGKLNCVSFPSCMFKP